MARTRSMTKMERDGLLINRIKSQLKKVQWIHLRFGVSMVIIFRTLSGLDPQDSMIAIHWYLSICCYEDDLLIYLTDFTQTDGIFVTAWIAAFFVDYGHAIMSFYLIVDRYGFRFFDWVSTKANRIGGIMCVACVLGLTAAVVWDSTTDMCKVITYMCGVAITMCVMGVTDHHLS